MSNRRIISPKSFPLRGGCVTYLDKTLLKSGDFSWMQNLRNEHPGLRSRKGQSEIHQTADGTNTVVNLYQYRQKRGTEKAVYAQMSDGDLLKSDFDIPTVTSGAFGTSVHAGGSGQVPASFSDIKDTLLYSNGADQHQLYSGPDSLVDQFVVFDGTAAPELVPTEGRDYTSEVRDSRTTEVATLDDLNTYAAFECIFIRTKLPVKSLSWVVDNANSNASTASVYYWNGAWTAVSGLSDGTDSGGATLAIDGEMSFTEPTDIRTKYQYGANGFWYQIRVSAQLSASVSVSLVTFNDNFKDLMNTWSGNQKPGVEVQVEGTSQWEVYGAGAVDVGDLVSGKKIMLASTDPIEGIYIDPGAIPNATGTTVTAIKYWDGTAFTTVGTVTDGTSGLSNPGWMLFPRQADVQPTQFGTSLYYAYWYELTLGAALAADMIIAMDYMPYFEISDFGSVGQSNAVWKDRACYSFDIYGPYIYVSQTGSSTTLNGTDYGILKAGDGRYNKVVAMRKFHNELMVWQEETGSDGGCVTIFEGYSPTTFGKLVLTDKIGAMNAKSVAVVDGVMTATKTDERLRTMAFFLSRYGVCASDGRTVSVISDDIQNYFDPQEDECIRRGYEDKMWLNHDSADNIIRIGLVTGTTATVPNTFLVFDLIDKTWSFDTLGQTLYCMTEIEALAGDRTIIQLGGGEGKVYRLNNTTDDVTTAIDSYVDLEINGNGQIIILDEMIIRMKEKSSGSLTCKFYKNSTLSGTKTLTMSAAKPGDSNRRHRFYLNMIDQHLSIRIQNDTISEDFFLHDLGVGVKEWQGV